MNHRLLTPDEVAERWSVPRAHVYRLAREGRIPAVDFAAQRVHVRRSYAQYSRRVKAPKSGRVRSVPLVPELIGPLDGLSRPSEVAARFAATRASAFNPRGPRAGWGV